MLSPRLNIDVRSGTSFTAHIVGHDPDLHAIYTQCFISQKEFNVFSPNLCMHQMMVTGLFLKVHRRCQVRLNLQH